MGVDPSNIEVRILSEAEARGMGKGADAKLAAIDAFLARHLSPDEVAFLKSHETAILRWIRAHPENAARFAADPLQSLIEAGLLTDPRLVAVMRNIKPRIKLAPDQLPPDFLRAFQSVVVR